MSSLILSLNCGSSSLKFGAYDAKSLELQCEGEAEEIGRAGSKYWLKQGAEKKEQTAPIADHKAAFAHALSGLSGLGLRDFSAVGHRVVHGGPKIRDHQTLTEDVEAQLKEAVPFAPLHLPSSLAVISAVSEKMPAVKQVICLDTAFHKNMPAVSKTFALPADLRSLGIERYGFHGLSLESIVAQLETVPERLVVAHLGNGSSITAIQNGQSIDTSMGLTPTGGIMMGTRCGDLDPGVMLFLMRHGFTDPEKLEDIVDHKSGLAGISEIGSDVRQLMQARANDARADLALRMFAYQARKTIAAMAGALGGIDLLVFTGGIGEHAEDLRKEICSHFEFMSFEIRVLPAEEDLQIARITKKLAA